MSVAGIIADRYARAFYLFADGNGAVDTVYEQVRVLLSCMGRLPKFRKALEDARNLSLEQRLGLMADAVAPAALCVEASSIYRLMDANGRVEHFRLMLLDFLNIYRDARNIRMVRVTTADDDTSLDDKVEALLKEKFNCDARVTHRKNPDIIGGFVVESWGYRLDASVVASLDALRKELKGRPLLKQ